VYRRKPDKRKQVKVRPAVDTSSRLEPYRLVFTVMKVYIHTVHMSQISFELTFVKMNQFSTDGVFQRLHHDKNIRKNVINRSSLILIDFQDDVNIPQPCEF
jgi:hypothetical protein